MGQAWYVLKTKRYHESRVASLLSNRGLEVYLPMVRRVQDQNEGPLFPGYLFARLDSNAGDILRTRSAPGVSYILGYDGQPCAVTDSIVAAVREGVTVRGGVLQPAFQQGERVSILAGEFRDLEAIFDCSLSPTGRSQVFISVLGHQMAVWVDDDHLGKAVARG